MGKHNREDYELVLNIGEEDPCLKCVFECRPCTAPNTASFMCIDPEGYFKLKTKLGIKETTSLEQAETEIQVLRTKLSKADECLKSVRSAFLSTDHDQDSGIIEEAEKFIVDYFNEEEKG